jgi:hypothetical protein
MFLSCRTIQVASPNTGNSVSTILFSPRVQAGEKSRQFQGEARQNRATIERLIRRDQF